jgi:shikimate kinase
MSALVLVGVPGAGKSSVGPLLASLLNRQFIDSDDAIVAKVGKSISDIFIEDGEPKFREIEAQTIAELLANPDLVVALGGGAVTTASTRDLLKNQQVVWLQAGLSSAVERVGLNRNRPLLLGNVRGQLHELMVAREPLYREVANFAIATDDKTVQEIAHEIASELDRT